MRAYLERAKAHDAFMQGEISEYEIGKRHLANIMGADPDNFSQEDIDKAVEYLLPSGLFDKEARPKMKHPHDVIPKRKAAEFDVDGRPFHTYFYTAKPQFFKLMHDAVFVLESLKKEEDKMLRRGEEANADKKIIIGASVWLTKPAVEEKLQEKLSDEEYDSFIRLFTRIIEHPISYAEETFIMQYRRVLSAESMISSIPELIYDEAGRPYQEAEGARKTSKAYVKIWSQGSGHVTVNGTDLLDCFPEILDREQVMSPLHFTNTLGRVDIEARVEGGGHSSRAGALREEALSPTSSEIPPLRVSPRIIKNNNVSFFG
ncbi:hypothetical protein CAPTEDRAFT_148451 [Capitella teleta]|uniref:30S ribosomal protein S9 n=1 Tax=Capitella teleta TaxID=283909 RepID=R7UIH9_CAPTE|nr:hypothetical protein CAPTEDRAFT_148451 [Capitella teleta]|eukprot:ELU03593.1 hypothetical protein CAPTEDRAFT_148451 [Capitella teleta]